MGFHCNYLLWLRFVPVKCQYSYSYLVRTDPADVARVESKTLISTPNKRDTIPTPAEGVEGKLGKWLSPADMENAFNDRFPGCMKGRICTNLLSAINVQPCMISLTSLSLIGYNIVDVQLIYVNFLSLSPIDLTVRHTSVYNSTTRFYDVNN